MSAHLHIGTSGWHYAHWRGVFYPPDIQSDEWLAYYASSLRCVEINNSFYRLPDRATFAQWAAQTPDDFRFAVKAWRLITHRKKLKDCRGLLRTFLAPVAQLGEKLGPILFQLPPRWHCNPARLDEFLAQLPATPTRRYAFEFRDPSWHVEEIYERLAERGAAFCIFELGELRSPLRTTADFVYVRLHGPAGPYAGSYSRRALRRWADRLCAWRDEGREVWLFFDNDEAGYAVRNALLLQGLVAG